MNSVTPTSRRWQTNTEATALRRLTQGGVLVSVPLLSMMGAVLLAPVLPRMQTEFHDVPHADVWVPLLLTIPALCQALLSPVAGSLADAFGARRVLYWGLFLYGLAGVVPCLLASLPIILASRVLVGVTEAALATAATALLAHYFRGDERHKWISYQQIVLPLCLVALLQLTGWLGDLSWRATFAAYALSWLILIAAVWVIRTDPPVPEHRTGLTTLFPSWRTSTLLAAIAVPTSVLFYAAPIEIGFLLQQHGFNNTSTVANALSWGVLLGPVGALVARRSTGMPVGRLLAGSAFIMVVGLCVMASSSSLVGITSGMAIQQLGGNLMLITGITFTVSLAPADERARYAGSWWFFYFLANFAAPLVTSALRTLTGSHPSSLFALAALSVVPLIWFLGSARLQSPLVQNSST